MGKGPPLPEGSSKNTHKLLGTFSVPPPLCLGDAYSGRSVRDERSKGRQMSVSVLRHEKSRIEPGTFSAPLMLWSESKDVYTTGIPYRQIYSEKKKGFGTGDFPRRDEFSNTIRTAQLREILARETKSQRKLQKKHQDDLGKIGTALSTASSILESYAPVRLPAAPLYDVVTRIPEPSLKLTRDDRQARLWYMQERNKLIEAQNMMASDPSCTLATQPASIARWYAMKVDGRLIDVLVDDRGQVVGQRSGSVAGV